MDKKIKLKDTEKAFALTTHRVKVFNHKKNLIVDSEIKRIGHYEVFRDWTILLKSGAEIWLDSGIIDLIVAHELKESTTTIKSKHCACFKDASKCKNFTEGLTNCGDIKRLNNSDRK